jgi:hypothetical protein
MASAMVGVVAGVLMAGISMGAPPGASADPAAAAARCEALAGGLQIGSELQPVVIDLCRRSSTFRRQMARLADAERLTVTVRQVVFPPTASWRAQAAITRVGGQVRSVNVLVPAGGQRLVAELIAHEFEHVLEQLDGVDLQRWVGRSGVRRVGTDQSDSPIETERAIQVGRLVAGEFVAATAEITALRAW